VDSLCGILLPIEKGQIALTCHMPPSHAWHKEKDEPDFISDRISWMIDQAHLADLPDLELVMECQKRLGRLHDRSERAIESSIVKDLLVMQSDLRYEYRRFVIITDSTGASNISREAASSNSASKADIKDGVSSKTCMRYA
jgi:hypothetical protein